MEREGFVFYRSFYDAIKNMDDATCAACFRALCEYGLNGVEMAADPISAAILTMAKPNVDKNNKKYENGKTGGRPKNQTEPNHNQTITKPKPNDNQTKPNRNQTITKTEKPKPKETEKETETETEISENN